MGVAKGNTHLQWFAAPDMEDRCILFRGKACGVPNDPTSYISHVFGNTYTTFHLFRLAHLMLLDIEKKLGKFLVIINTNITSNIR